MKKILLLTFTIVFAFSANSQFLTDLSPEERAKMSKNNISSDEIASFGFSSEIPSSYSLERYAVVSDQKGSSCTGHAVAGAMNIMYNKFNNITRYSEQLVNRFDPLYIYCSIKKNDDLRCIDGDGCSCGTHILEALTLLEKYGCKKRGLDPFLKCGTTLNSAHLQQMSQSTKKYSIDGIVDFVDWTEDWDIQTIHIERVKESIFYGFPLVTGISVGDDFDNTTLAYSASQEPAAGRHAVTIVGYDDNYNGGSFRILNSYGTDFGDKGFFWITYNDFRDLLIAGIYLLYNDDLDYSSWIDPVSTTSFYKGDLKNGFHWEGPMSGNSCHGKGVLVGEDFSAVASYDNGIANGWWMYLGDSKDDFWGLVLYEDGEVIDRESWGFADEENLFIINNSEDVTLSSENPSDDNIDKLEEIGEDALTPSKSKFNFNKTNSYNKNK